MKILLLKHKLKCTFGNHILKWIIKTTALRLWTANWAAPSEFVTYRLCEQRRFRRACASAQSRQNLRCSLIQSVSQEEPSDRKPDPWSLWMAGHAQLKFVMTECSKTQIRLTRPNYWFRSCWFNYLSPVKRICVFEHSVMTNFNCACPAIQRG